MDNGKLKIENGCFFERQPSGKAGKVFIEECTNGT
jgi:hypothetical protein